jgi:hypothetical protein
MNFRYPIPEKRRGLLAVYRYKTYQSGSLSTEVKQEPEKCRSLPAVYRDKTYQSVSLSTEVKQEKLSL